MPADDPGRKLYRARRPGGEVDWVDHDELWQLQQSQAEEVRRNQTRRRRIAVAALCALLALVAVAVVYRLRSPADAPAPPPAAGKPGAAPRAGPADSGRPAVTAAAGGTAPGSSANAPEGAAAADGPPPPVPAPAERVESAVRAWADAWARQDVNAYLASYAAEFEPPDGLTRPEWVSLRRRRVLDRASIRLQIEELTIELRGAGRAEARFRQSYSSPSYSDVVRKTLRLVEEEGDWRIAAEQASPP